MYRAMGDSNFAVERTNAEKAQEALANFVPPGYEQENPALTPDGALHVRYDLPAQTVHDEAARILQAMDLAGPADPASALSLTTRLGVTLRVEPVMESGCDLIIAGIRGGSHEATGANFEAVQNLLQCLQERLPPAATEAEPEPRYAPAPR
ncbi:MAG: hypothetical protein JNL25_02550, partial [Rhodospirillaceae bacterium]|nr:hypothetical protein [Rhodospirillaceae bacterium]